MFNFNKLCTLQKLLEVGTGDGDGGASNLTSSMKDIPTQNPAPWISSKKALQIGALMNYGTSLLGTPKEYEGDYGHITQAADGIYDNAANFAELFGPTGKAIAFGMLANKLLGGITKKLGGGTDGMTKTDAILGSAFLQMTPLGLINGFGGKKAKDLTLDLYTLSQSNFSYAGSSGDIMSAKNKAGKKYGAFSKSGLVSANLDIDRAAREQNQLKYLIENRDLTMDALGNSADLYNTGYANELMGSPQPMIAAKRGAKITRKDISRVKRIASKHKFTKAQLKKAADEQDDLDAYKNGGLFQFDVSMFLKGGKSKKYTYNEFINIVNPERLNMDWFNYQGFYDDDEFYPEWELKYEEWLKLPESPDKDVNRPHMIDKYKTEKHPTYSDGEHYGWVGSDEDGWKFYVSPRQRMNWSFEDYMKYWDKAEPESVLIYSPTQTYKRGDEFTKNINSHKDGGKLEEKPNLIPEGALHARKHHIEEANPDLKGEITLKGIPVITEEDGGTVQLAEIEVNEIIFQKSVTEELEKLYKLYNETDSQSKKDEIAIECGKLVSKLIIENTDDKTGLINETN